MRPHHSAGAERHDEHELALARCISPTALSRCLVNASSTASSIEAVARGYLEAVYRMQLPPAFDTAAFAASREWLYRAPIPVTGHRQNPVPLACQVSSKVWRSTTCRAVLNANQAGIAVGMAPRIDRWGLWNPAGHPYQCDEQPHGATSATRAFASDHTWMEVIRWSSLGSQEGAGLGCWWFAAPGSGIFLRVGRSLRVHNRSELASTLGLNVSDYTHTTESGFIVGRLSRGFPRILDTPELRAAYFKKNPWVLEHRGGQSFCPRAVVLGYDTIQVRQEECSWPQATSGWCYMEVISCHPACTSVGVRKLKLACPSGLPLRTGLNASLKCECNNARDIANCERTGNASILPLPYHIPGNRATYPVREAFDRLGACKV